MENRNDSIIFIYLCSLSTTHHINTNFVHKETFKYIMYSIINSYRVYNLLKNIYPDIAIYIRYHHERIDGIGYPDNLKGSQIPLESKIISVADAIDAMSSIRSYNTPKSFDSVITELLHCADKQFDSKIVDTAITVLKRSKSQNVYNLDNEIEFGTLTIKIHQRSYNVKGNNF